MVSEVMLQQTPVARVAPVWEEWMRRWPTPAALAAASTAEVLGAWGRLGYPRRALRLHDGAAHILAEKGGQVPSDTASLRAIPGIGEYTAAAIQAFAFKQPVVVLDVNIRRVLTRVFLGADLTSSSITATERELGAAALTEVDADLQWNSAIMEFGALICTARNPLCAQCPIQDRCQWKAAGYPEPSIKRRSQAWTGTDRQVRGTVIDHLRAAPGFTAPIGELLELWPDQAQLRKALSTLSEDSLIHEARPGQYALGTAPDAN